MGSKGVRRLFCLVALAATLAVTLAVGPGAGVGFTHGASTVSLTLSGEVLSTKGVLMNGVTMVPAESLGVELGFTVNVCNDEDEIVLSKGNRKITLSEGRSVAEINGHEVRLYNRPVREGNEVMIPLRFVLENMGYHVIWQGAVHPTVDLRPIHENDIIIGTIRERQETAILTIDMQYPKISGLSPEVQDPMNAYFAERVKPALEQGYESERDSKAGPVSWPTDLFLNYRVAYNQKGLLSIVFDDYLYMGGAHGGTERYGYTADIKTGRVFELNDLFRPEADYVSLLSAEVRKQIEAMGIEPLSPFTEIRSDQDFYIEKDSLVIYFQQYELMPYAYGFPEFRIPMASLTDVLAPELAGIDWIAGE